MAVTSEQLKESMRMWASGVAIITASFNGVTHGMTINSFHSISIDPPYVCVTLANRTRTRQLVDQAGFFAVTILAVDQMEISDRFAGRVEESFQRFAGLELGYLLSEAPVIAGGLAFFDCSIVKAIPLAQSTLYIAEVNATDCRSGNPLLYLNRTYRWLVE